MILKLECLYYQNKFYFILLYTSRAISTQKNPKTGLVEKKRTILKFYCIYKPIYISLY